MEKKKVYISNFTRFASHDEGESRVKVITNDAGEELGFEVRGTLTTFDVRNENGMVFTKGSYDKFVDDYFIKNSLNVPLCIQHEDTDIRNLCGYVKSMTKTESGVEMVGFVPRCAYYYNLIKQYIEIGILQGFSNCGGIIDADYDSATDTLNVKDFALLHAAIVCTPADTGAKMVANTVFKGFTKQEKSEPEADAPSVNEILPNLDDYETVI